MKLLLKLIITLCCLTLAAQGVSVLGLSPTTLALTGIMMLVSEITPERIEACRGFFVDLAVKLCSFPEWSEGGVINQQEQNAFLGLSRSFVDEIEVPGIYARLPGLTSDSGYINESPCQSTASSIPDICKTCQHLHGKSYSGTMLVCGMHPYGNGEECGDFEPNWMERELKKLNEVVLTRPRRATLTARHDLIPNCGKTFYLSAGRNESLEMRVVKRTQVSETLVRVEAIEVV